MARRFLQPPDSVCISARPSGKPARPSARARRAGRSTSSTAASASPIASSTVPWSGSTGSCATKPTRTPPRTDRPPVSGGSIPARILSKVDLPEPLRPTSPTWSPSKSPNDSPSKSDRDPYALLTA